MEYERKEVKRAGMTFRVVWSYDDCMNEPWKEHEGHGEVSDWTARSKRPGELVLLKDRGMALYYDFAATVEKARAEGWGRVGFESKTRGERAAAAVWANFEYLRRWCENQWHWCGIVVTLLDDDGEETDIECSLWGLESEGDDYHAEVIEDLITQCLQCFESRTYPVTECGV